MDPTALALAIVNYFFMKASDGAIQKLGEDFTSKLYKLKGIVQDWSQNRARGKEATEKPEVLEAEIIEEFSNQPNSALKSQLENVVQELQQIEKNNVNPSQTNTFGNNQAIGSVKGGNVAAGNQENYFR
jgi:hypothetical protein